MPNVIDDGFYWVSGPKDLHIIGDWNPEPETAVTMGTPASDGGLILSSGVWAVRNTTINNIFYPSGVAVITLLDMRTKQYLSATKPSQGVEPAKGGVIFLSPTITDYTYWVPGTWGGARILSAALSNVPQKSIAVEGNPSAGNGLVTWDFEAGQPNEQWYFAPMSGALVRDQRVPTSAGTENIGARSAWQSFTPSLSGPLVQVVFDLTPAAACSGTLNLYLGEGVSSSPPLLTNAVTFQPGLRWSFVYATQHFLNAGTKYTLELLADQQLTFRRAPASAYSGGRSNDPTKSLCFETWMMTSALPGPA